MALSIIKADARGAYRLIAEHDLYLDESGQKIIVVKDGEVVPPEAAVVLAGKGGTIPTRYAKMLDELDKPEEVKVEPEAKPALELAPEPKPEPPPAKSKPTKEKAISA